MQLLRLEMKGFKSFADKTIVQFSPGMTAIVGPNGSGKSNITDAMRWVLGESNIRNLRGQKAEDIIFAGTEKRRPMSTAEVTLVFDNSDGRLGEGKAEVAVTRRIYRNGDSEFYINKESCRLKDIQLLLADTGLGRDSMAIIGQNRVDAILNSKAEERRLIFEDVAGISRFKLNKEDALRRINATERNMERVGDVMAKLEEQLVPMGEAAAKTTEHNRLAREKRDYDGALAFHDYKTADRLFTRWENEKLGADSALQEVQARLQDLDAKREDVKNLLATERERVRNAEDEFGTLRQEAESWRGRREIIATQRKAEEKAAADLKARLEELQALLDGDRRQLTIADEFLSTGEAKLQELTEAEAAAQAAYDQAVAAVTAKEEQQRQWESEAAAAEEAHVAHVAELEQQRAMVTQLQLQDAELTEQAKTLVAELDECTKDRDVAVQVFDDAVKAYDDVVKQRETERATLREKEQQLADTERQWQQLRQDLRDTEGRLQLLAQWEAQHEGYAEGTRNVLRVGGNKGQQNGNGTPQWRQHLRGAVGDLFTVEEPYITAIDIALGGAVNYVVADSSRAASDAVAYLKKTQGGRTTFLPMDAVKGRNQDQPALKESCVQGRAVDCITFDKQYTDIFTHLLGQTLVVDTMENAIGLQKKYNQRLRLVTLAGEQFHPGGSLTGGSVKRRKASVLERKEEQRGLQEQLDALQQKQETLTKAGKALRDEVMSLQQQLASGDEARDKAHLERVTAENRRDAAQERYDRKVRVAAETETKQKSLQERLQAAQTKVTEMEATVGSFDRSATTADRQTALRDIDTLRQAQHEALEALTKQRLEREQVSQSLKERRDEATSRREAAEKREASIAPLQDELAAVTKRLTEDLPKEAAAADKAVQDAEEKVKALEAERAQLYKDAKEHEETFEQLSKDRTKAEAEEKQWQKTLLDAEGRLVQAKMTGEQSMERLTKLGFNTDDARKLQLDGNVADWKAKRSELAQALDELGAVNPNAVTEYEAAQENLSFYEKQQADLVTAKDQLTSVINEIDGAMADRLKEVMAIIAERFQDVFSRLFGGGTAQIAITDPDNILTSGIEFYIQPPGKKRQQLTLLSGGERALTVIALLFSFLDFRPAPFCVLDEVDAALDEANVERFGHYLQHMGDETQFIIVSHRKRTMEAASVLQGVTMAERGISRLLTVTFDEVEEDN